MISPPTEVPAPARVVTMILTMFTIAILAVFFTRRLHQVKSWTTLPVLNWLVLAIYVDSFFFVFFTGILSKAFSVNASAGFCDAAILLCLISYMSTKILLYYFLVEKCYLIRSAGEPRRQSKLWLFNFFGVICPYIVLVVLMIVYRISYMNKEGVCIIGMQRNALVPTIVFDVFLNVWLTTLFLQPLRDCYSYKQQSSSRLRNVVVRTFVGSCATLALSITNLTVIAILDGEPGYICLCLCNLDILCTTLILHWVSSVDAPEDNDVSSNARRIQNIVTIRAASNSSTKPDLLEGAEKGVTLQVDIEFQSGSDDASANALSTNSMQDTEVLNYNPSAKSARESREFDQTWRLINSVVIKHIYEYLLINFGATTLMTRSLCTLRFGKQARTATVS
ncbi:hypothetical protein M438DRAFT_181388 [Aureobasidium pullulans EXF-150]|uniref:G-protein coupled receptors family 1 profile domain-containing protein n=1 Tax=Aureobasidium pullulans EXF-150 TaxID=1043002 RepID=A0A074XMF6_AURPU|nr:uncharacterized protein M438DRAFT_181388 [Aureobasidium pullulans EXF-150]KEQ86705.1 hypothetical protein M438DRAFT_181388 [Aureobasidium pullulans EXF-150]